MYGFIEGFKTEKMPTSEQLQQGGLTSDEAYELIAKQARLNDEQYTLAVVRVLSDYANCMNRNAVPFATAVTGRTHRTLQQSIMGLMLTTLNAWATLPADQYDLRNEFTVQLARKVLAALETDIVLRDGEVRLPCV